MTYWVEQGRKNESQHKPLPAPQVFFHEKVKRVNLPRSICASTAQAEFWRDCGIKFLAQAPGPMKSSSIEQPADVAAKHALRPVLPEDEEFLFELYASTRADELAQIPWNEAQLKTFLRMQFKAREQSYRMHYPELQDRIILFQNERVGRFAFVHMDEWIRMVDIALLPEYCGVGIGTSLLKELIAGAKEEGKPIRLLVEKPNVQARRLYERMGFTTAGESLTHFQMEYRHDA
jgi:ribosomal protein S18 acetylase RimI-like enzyme